MLYLRNSSALNIYCSWCHRQAVPAQIKHLDQLEVRVLFFKSTFQEMVSFSSISTGSQTYLFNERTKLDFKPRSYSGHIDNVLHSMRVILLFIFVIVSNVSNTNSRSRTDPKRRCNVRIGSTTRYVNFGHPLLSLLSAKFTQQRATSSQTFEEINILFCSKTSVKFEVTKS
jgi:hypothetical protein